MKISFVIPARNETALDHTIASLSHSTSIHSFEIIVVDDYSEQPLQVRSPLPIKLIRNNKREGISRSRNIGARAAVGEILIFLDAHVGLQAGWVDALLSRNDLSGSTIVGTATELLTDFDLLAGICAGTKDIPNLKRYYGWRVELGLRPDVWPLEKINTDRPFNVPIASACCMAVNRKFFEWLGCFEDELTGGGSVEDAELCLRCWLLGGTVTVDPAIICCHLGLSHKGTPDADPETTVPLLNPRYEPDSVENALRVIYLLFPEEYFNALLDHVRLHPLWNKERENFSSSNLIRRRQELNSKRKLDHEWLLRFMADYS